MYIDIDTVHMFRYKYLGFFCTIIKSIIIKKDSLLSGMLQRDD